MQRDKVRTLLFAVQILLLVVTFFASCTAQGIYEGQAWFKKTRQAIGTQANLNELAGADSVTFSATKDSTYRCEYRFSKGQVFIEMCDSQSRARLVRCFSNDGRFEWRRENCSIGTRVFEGIFFDGEADGLSTWHSCDSGVIVAEGVRYKGRKVGVWRERRGGRLEQVDYGNNRLVYEMPEIHED